MKVGKGYMRDCNCLNQNPLQGQLPTSEDEATTASDTSGKIQLLTLGLLLTGAFSGIEWGAGHWSHSLSLVADAGHMFFDCAALGLSLGATMLAHLARQYPWLKSERAEILAALANGLGLLVLAVWIAWEAFHRFLGRHPAVVSEVMLAIAILGLGFNLLAVSLLHDHSHHNLNIRGAFLHVLADTVSSVGVILAAVLIWAFHWPWIDTVISVAISTLIGLSALPLLRASVVALRMEKI